MPETTPVSAYLLEQEIPHRVFRHPGPIYSLEQAARERDQLPEQVVRSIVFRIGQGEYVMVLAAGPEQISWPALRSFLGQSRLTMASQEEVLAATGYETGAVSPFGLPRQMRILVDKKLLLQDEVSIGSGVRGTTIILRVEELMKALGDVEVGEFLSSSSQGQNLPG